MKVAQKIAGISLVFLLAATGYALWRTSGPAFGLLGTVHTGAATQHVDQTPLLTAQKLAQMPTTAEELPFAQEALRLADQEMDLAFAAAVRKEEEHPPTLSGEAKQIQARLQDSENALDRDKARVEQLAAAEAKAGGARKDALDDQLEAGKAQVELDQDEIDEAKEDLARAGGDLQGRIEALRQEHEAASKAADTMKVTVTAAAEARGLIHHYQQWAALHSKQQLLSRAKHDAEAAAALFTGKHDELESRIAAQKEKPRQKVATANASRANSTASAPGKKNAVTENAAADNGDNSTTVVAATKRRASDQRALTNFAKRIDDQKQMANVYGNWISVVAAQQRSVIHRALRGVLLILLIALIALFFENWISQLLRKLHLDRRQEETLRTVTRVALQVVAVLFILLVIFGPPTQLGTFIGLATAGLTVALKDFIVGFIGWFVLMGKNGIRLGDWVEINGVTGEVGEIGMFHTVLMETGNWTDSGHPTGRRVTFTNSYAIEGHYFNFSTAGQWLWDELQVTIPEGRDPFPLVEAIHQKVLEATQDSAKQAEAEWQRASGSRDLSSISAVPAINMRPAVGGIEVQVRYVTRANERYQLRTRLYQTLVELLGGRGARVSPKENPA
jgi:small-conductance mechanosensitive channel